MASKSRRIPNVGGAANGPLSMVSYVDKAQNDISTTSKNAPANWKVTTYEILETIKHIVEDANTYQRKLDAKLSDVILGRVASLLDEVLESFKKDDLEQMKQEIIDEISGISTSTILQNLLVNGIIDIFDDRIRLDDIEALKIWMLANFGDGTVHQNEESQNELSSQQTSQENEQTTETEAEDEEAGEFKDSTPAKNFFTLQTFVQHQFDILNENLKNIPGQSGMFSKMKAFMSQGFLGIMKKVTSFGKSTIGAIASKVGSIGKGMKPILAGIGYIGKKVGGALASPFKKIGNIFSKFNFTKTKNAIKDAIKQKIRDKLLSAIEKILNKLWKIVEPFVSMVTKFIWMAIKTIVIPIAIIMAKVLLITAAITLLGVGLYLAYRWIKKKIAAFWEYIVSGELWKDIKDWLSKIWNWYLNYLKLMFIDIPKWVGAQIARFAEWVWDKICDFGNWIWDKLCEFGAWLYDNYIDKYIVKPFKQYIWEPIKKLWNQEVWPVIAPFIQSLTELKDKIMKAFSAWDTNKSIWDNLKNMTSIIKDAVVEWWDTSPFKTLWDQSVWPMIKMFINELTKLKDTLLGVFKGWDTNKPFLENLVGLGTAIVSAVKQWWTESELKKLYDRHIQPLIDKALAYLNDLLKPIRDWYDQSALKEWINKLGNALNSIFRRIPSIDKFKQALSNLPFVGKYFKSNVPSKEDDELQKFNQMMSKIMPDINQQSIVMQSNNATLIEQQKQQATNIAMQQVQNMAQPIQSIQNINNNESTTLQKTSQEMSESIQQKENDSSQFNEEQSMKTDKLIDMMNMFMPQVLKKLDNPQKIPVVVPYQTDYATNNANMSEF